ATGGFNEKLFGAEDAAMCWALKREGRFAVLWLTVLTSGRRLLKNPRMSRASSLGWMSVEGRRSIP
ncbi:MAG TPA: hypothetical protein VIT18_03685, partial [Terrimicrobiaceae bacterium]